MDRTYSPWQSVKWGIPVAALIAFLAFAWWWQARRGYAQLAAHVEPAATAPQYVGGQSCAECHQAEYEQWLGSHHDLAMQVADEQTVLGDFNDAQFTHFDVVSTFFRKDGRFFVRTDGPDGEPHDYPVRYTFGIEPLQQYLIELPNGRMQALTICWDTRPKEEGGQRWFHLYPDERIGPDDVLHWAGPNLNWNHMCAECHSTNLQKNYDFERDRFNTNWSEINVSCEACHGPGSNHVAWARALPSDVDEELLAGDKGLAVLLKDTGGGGWVMDKETGTSKRTSPLSSSHQIETCARCHSRRVVIDDAYHHGRPILDSHRTVFLDENLYYPDGQIQDEVYVYGSFLQSKMYHAGVTCSDCHNPHSAGMVKVVDASCYRCHNATKYAKPEHHHHPIASTGASCIECHMPARNYMVVDPRRDHSIRVPRPDLSVKLGTPNACNICHNDQAPEWAAQAYADWYGAPEMAPAHYGETIHAGRLGAPSAERPLIQLAEDKSQPAIVRATAIELLNPTQTVQGPRILSNFLQDESPLVRLAAVESCGLLPPNLRFGLIGPLLDDNVRAVRLAAAWALAEVPSETLSPDQKARLENAIEQYLASQWVNADRAESHMNRGTMLDFQRDYAAAEQAYRDAIRLDPLFLPAYINFADHFRHLDRDDQGELILREAITTVPQPASAHYALGLLLVRQQRGEEALQSLALAAQEAPDISRFSYVYAIALNSLGQPEKAFEVLREAHQRHPYDRDILLALTTICRDHGDRKNALRFAMKLQKLMPDNPSVHDLVNQLSR